MHCEPNLALTTVIHCTAVLLIYSLALLLCGSARRKALQDQLKQPTSPRAREESTVTKVTIMKKYGLRLVEMSSPATKMSGNIIKMFGNTNMSEEKKPNIIY